MGPRRLRRLALALLPAFLAPLVSSTGQAAESALLSNADLSAWEAGLPSGWTVEDGATNGEGATSEVTRGPEGGLRLAGTAETKRWRLVRQAVEVPAATTVLLRCEARVSKLTREAGQFANAYVGLGTWSAVDGSLAGVRTENALREVWTPVELVGRVAGGVRAGPIFFLSMSGALEVRKVEFRALAPSEDFDLLVGHVARYYSFLSLKGPSLKGSDWRVHAGAYRQRALEAPDEAGFVQVLRELLAPLNDLHVSVRRSTGEVVPTVVHQPVLNVEGKRLLAVLTAQGAKPAVVGRVGLTARIGDEIGYLAIGSLAGSESEHAQVRLQFRGLLSQRALLIDLRGNGGGDETRAQALVSLLTDEPRVYARRRVRNGPLPTDFTSAEDAVLQPARGAHAFRGPIVVLLGPGCVSSGEGMAQMLDALPTVRTLGQPTRGASGNPAPVPLSNGVDVWFSRWVNEQMDGTPLEGRGVQPDVLVAHAGAGDSTLEAGLAEVRALLAARDGPGAGPAGPR